MRVLSAWVARVVFALTREHWGVTAVMLCTLGLFVQRVSTNHWTMHTKGLVVFLAAWAACVSAWYHRHLVRTIDQRDWDIEVKQLVLTHLMELKSLASIAANAARQQGQPPPDSLGPMPSLEEKYMVLKLTWGTRGMIGNGRR